MTDVLISLVDINNFAFCSIVPRSNSRQAFFQRKLFLDIAFFFRDEILYLLGWHFDDFPRLGISQHLLSKDTLLINNRSSLLSPLVGKSTICSAFITFNDSRNNSLISLQYLCLTILFNDQSMSGRLKSPYTQNGDFFY